MAKPTSLACLILAILSTIYALIIPPEIFLHHGPFVNHTTINPANITTNPPPDNNTRNETIHPPAPVTVSTEEFMVYRHMFRKPIPPSPPPAAAPMNQHNLTRRADPVSQLLHIMPSSSTCLDAPILDECTTASAAAQPLIASFQKYSVLTAPEQAALLSMIAYESGEMKYNQNHFPAPGVPGAGTKNMMSPQFVAEYAASFPELQSSLVGKSPAQILALVQPDQYTFGSAAWFYDNKCSDEIKNGVKNGGQAGWESYVTQCVGTTVDEGRIGYWTKANEALSVSV